MVTRKEVGISARMKRHARLMLYALVPVLAFVACRLWILIPKAQSFYLQVHMTASVDGIAQVYYDTGKGLAEEASTRLNVEANDSFREYRFRLPRETIYSFRFDPLMSGGTVSVKDMTIVNGLGRNIFSVDFRWIQPGQQIQSLGVVGNILIAVMESSSRDPQLVISLPEPLRPERVWSLPSFAIAILHSGARVFFESAILYWIVTIFLVGGRCFLSSGLAVNLRGRVPMALILALFVIGVIEGIQHGRLPAEASYHEVDKMLYRLERERFNADGVILGSSVANQVFTHPSFLERTNMAMLATNEAIGMTGQYFIMKRFMERNQPPRLVILLAMPNMEGSLSSVMVDNYICRTFTRSGEILDVLQLKRDPVFSLKTATYRIFPSFKYRLHLQNNWLRFTNDTIYTGAAHTGGSGKNEYAITQILQRALTKNDIPQRHFVKLLEMLKAKGIPLHFVTPPIKEGNRDLQRRYGKAFEQNFPAIRKEQPLFHWSDKIVRYPDRFFNDDVHFSEDGLLLARPYLYGIVDEIVRSFRGEAQKR